MIKFSTSLGSRRRRTELPASVQAVVVREETLSPEEYMRLVENHPERIKSVQVVPPQLGNPGDFGGLRVTYKTPIFKTGKR